MMTGPNQHFYSSILDAWRYGIFAKLSERKGFWEMSLLILKVLWERDKMLLRAILCGVFGTDFFLARPRRTTFLVDFVVKKMVMVICSGTVPFTLFSMFGNFLSAASGPGVFFGMVGCLVSMALVIKIPWATSFGDLASFHLERCLGAYPVDFADCWTPPDYWDADDIALEIPEHPNVWTDGSGEDFSSLGGFEVAGAGVYVLASELAFDSSSWGTAEEYGDARLERCRAFLPVPGVMQTVQRAEFWGAILAMQAYWPCHLGIDNLNVARSIGRLLDHGSLNKPLPLVKDGDLVALVQNMFRTRGRKTVRVTKVKGHAEDFDVHQGSIN